MTRRLSWGLRRSLLQPETPPDLGVVDQAAALQRNCEEGSPAPSRTGPGEASHGDDLVLHHVQADHARPARIVEMAAHSIAHQIL